MYCVSDKQCGTGASSWGLKEESPDLNGGRGSCLLLEANRGCSCRMQLTKIRTIIIKKQKKRKSETFGLE